VSNHLICGSICFSRSSLPFFDSSALKHAPEGEATESTRGFGKRGFKRPVLKLSYFLPENLENETIFRVPGETRENMGNSSSESFSLELKDKISKILNFSITTFALPLTQTI